MLADSLANLRDIVMCAGLACVYPIIVFIVAIAKIYEIIFGRTKCKVVAGEVALVTGGGHGLGRSIAIELAQKGCHIAIVDINIEEAESVVQHIQSEFNVTARAYKVDVSQYEQVEELKDQVSRDLGDVTILVNNAGILLLQNFKNPNWRDVQRMINVNLTAHFWTNSIFLPKMKELKKGHIVAISSIGSWFPIIYSGPYTSTKCAVRGLMRVLRLELNAEGFKHIKTTTIFPSSMDTNTTVVKVLRKTGMDFFQTFIKSSEAAKRVVKAVLGDEEEMVFPNFFAVVHRIFEFMPVTWTDFVQSRIVLLFFKIK